MLNEKLTSVAVVGAGGKMGSGISLLLLREIACLEASKEGQVGSGAYTLTLIDSNVKSLSGLRNYLRAQMTRFAEKQINDLREYYKNDQRLVSNQEMIEAFVQGAIDCLRFEEEIAQAKNAHLIFEAIVEEMDVKTRVFSELKKTASESALFFTNTSSLPIGVLAEASGLKGRMIGYHFYNPPAVQKLLEIIPAAENGESFAALADELAKRLGKIIVYSKDVAGFIGNGHFLREINEALKEVSELESSYTLVEALCFIDQMTRDLLIRPMGIFQLFDYVGIDVLFRVMQIMAHYLKIEFHSGLIDQMVAAGCTGGQYSDGSQKDGFFQYRGHTIEKIYDLKAKAYVDLPNDLIGELPKGHLPWKVMGKEKNREELLKRYLRNLFELDTLAARIASSHLLRSRDIARKLVADGVARSIDDVNTVIVNGFYHLYGPDDEHLPQEVYK
ncbi:3-hydroxyacyl-CoA dehydrogenase family protein [Waddlia chondrophila]|uniref:Putative 3-hydroxyacyl-CoA dehydrogenase n=1 Tax=Waddlia chondrophila (strain ATCC VR-1470 / WSU 86-1044) TaxID=716544 RepID=D6YRX6_WADCW|nr:3-hydroxyacyl-CoA dehydrogenase family protein [Waddlia chondrophila]ADI38821.1 putative 3-hydroxyacyl-CoA dehydrogenase [Waddlia chondrophila WSU 86-1044]